jgi:ureidoacrylate peracid hydrolase
MAIEFDPAKIDPATTGLLIIDMQNAFCHPEGTISKDGADVTPVRNTIEPLIRVINACREAGIQDFWSRQEHYDRDVTRIRHRIPPHTAKRPRPASVQGTWDSKIIDELKPLITDESEIFIKNRFGCFHNTNLETLLRIYGVDTLVVAGVDTNVCVETTLREAYVRDIDLIILEDCVGGVHQRWAEVAMEVWARFLGAVVSSDELIKIIEDARDRR